MDISLLVIIILLIAIAVALGISYKVLTNRIELLEDTTMFTALQFSQLVQFIEKGIDEQSKSE